MSSTLLPTLSWQSGQYAIYRLNPGAEPRLPAHGFSAILRTADEVTVIRSVEADSPGSEAPVSGPWALLRVDGTLPHDATGILSGISTALADAMIPIFALSTFDTDYLLVPAARTRDTDRALADRGYSVRSGS